ncbi:hypothetical protein [Acidovorax sp. SUPP3334]|uniref:hypothetical protein n=1 Tax=Acidovorax sp. SUPP3334 TaxID=2920881 RepID=UPI0023DE4AD5|nr:hypothetical protein [Acidovorax sp. SUPP3334]GKT21908.1 hypothetical protein AVHM3334_06480 [Acidovorax sp. SUPP3334]
MQFISLLLVFDVATILVYVMKCFQLLAGFDNEFVSWHAMVQGNFYNSNTTGVKKAPEGAS